MNDVNPTEDNESEQPPAKCPKEMKVMHLLKDLNEANSDNVVCSVWLEQEWSGINAPTL